MRRPYTMMNKPYTAQLTNRQQRPKRRNASHRALNASAALRVANTPAGRCAGSDMEGRASRASR